MQLTITNTNYSNNSLDQYYTKNPIAAKCTNQMLNVLANVININDYLFFEPSAGYGCFYDEIKKRNHPILAFDIQPKHKEVKRLDFLDNNTLDKVLQKNIKDKNTIIIGNPPFGKKSKLAIQFFNQASLFSNIICFILPNQFKKWTVHKQLNSEYKLVHENDLPFNSFYTEDKGNYHVGSVFQIWTKLKTKYKDKRINSKPPTNHKDFIMYQYNNTKESLKVFNNDFDFAIFSQGYGDYKTFITKKKDFDFKKQYILFKGKNKKVVDNLKKLNFEKLSKENTTVPGFRKNNIVAEYIKKYG